ncbi:MAG TPA: hypothetical protein DD381_10130 [Lentisphaeria bacterium]|nr:MAG: hypothetical protein A2X47_11905 [Lentisphaerae bacterium GWF2_38_69]HBM16682.1 hypothetical protein [Lentisphaeria bacterium]
MLRPFICLFVAALLLFQTSCSKKNEHNGAPPARPVHVSEAINHDVPVYIDAIGTLTAELSVDIQSQVTGKIISANFTEGQFVKKGDLLFEIDPNPYQAILNQSLALLSQNQADLDIAKWIVGKDKKLFETKAMSTQDYAKLMVAYDKAVGMVEADKATIWQNKINIEYCKITSPIDGITGKRLVDPGNIITANSGPTLVNIKTIDPLFVDFTISERNLLLLKDSMKKATLDVIVSASGFDSNYNNQIKHYEGTLQFVNNSIDPATGTIGLRAVIPNKDRELWPGQFINITLIYYIQKNALLVPNQAVTMGLKGEFVYVIKNGKAVLIWVKTGLKEGDYTIIDSVVGDEKIKPGDQLVTVGQMGLTPNTPVNIVGKDTFDLPSIEKILTENAKD